MAAVKAGVLVLPTTSHGAHKARADENRAAATSATSDERPRTMPAFSGLRVRYPDTNFMAVVPRPRPAKVEKATTVVWTRANWPKTSLPRYRAATTEPAKDALCPMRQPAAFQPTPRSRRSEAERGIPVRTVTKRPNPRSGAAAGIAAAGDSIGVSLSMAHPSRAGSLPGRNVVVVLVVFRVVVVIVVAIAAVDPNLVQHDADDVRAQTIESVDGRAQGFAVGAAGNRHDQDAVDGRRHLQGLREAQERGRVKHHQVVFRASRLQDFSQFRTH